MTAARLSLLTRRRQTRILSSRLMSLSYGLSRALRCITSRSNWEAMRFRATRQYILLLPIPRSVSYFNIWLLPQSVNHISRNCYTEHAANFKLPRGFRTISIGEIDGVKRPLINGKFEFLFGTLDQVRTFYCSSPTLES